MPARWWNARTVDSNDVSLGVDPAALLSDNFGIHFHTSIADQDFTRPARAYAGLGKHLLEAYAVCRLGHEGGS
jgi:hypothetical protein